MAVVTELVTEFKFKGDTKPLKEAGNQMQRVSENSGIAEARMEGAGDAFLGLGKKATVAIAGLAGLATAVVKTAEGILDIGKQTDELISLGINVAELRDFQDLFVEMGSSAEDATNFVKEVTRAQAQLAGGQHSPFLESLTNQFNTAFDSTESLDSILTKLRKNIQAQGLGVAEVSVRAGELGFTPQFSKVLLATDQAFSEAVKSSQEYAKVTNEQLKVTQELNEEWAKFSHELKRLNEEVLVKLAPIMLSVVEAMRDFLGIIEPGGTAQRRQAQPYSAPEEAGVTRFLRSQFGDFTPQRSTTGRVRLGGNTNNTNIVINAGSADAKKVAQEVEKIQRRSNNRTKAKR